MRYWLCVGVVFVMALAGITGCSGLELEPTQTILEIDEPELEPTQASAEINNGCSHYVDNQASSDGDGSVGTPWDNIAGHVDDLKAGDVLCVRGASSAPGRVYTEPTILLSGDNGTPSGTEASPITVRTYPGEHVVLHTTGNHILEFRQVSFWEFDGFIFDKESKSNYGIHFSWADSNVVRNCEVYNGTGEGIHFSYGEFNVIENCKIHDFDAGPNKDAHCILMGGGKGNVIRDNEIYDCTGDGIQFFRVNDVSGTIVEDNHFYTTLGPCSENAIDYKTEGRHQTIIRRNVMHGYRTNDGSCGGSGGGVGEAIRIHVDASNIRIAGNEIYDSGSGIMVTNGEDIEIINNVIHDIVTDPDAWTNIGIYVKGVKRIDILNNTLVNIPRDGLRVGEGAIPNLNIRNNLFFNTGRSYRKDTEPASAVDYNGWFNVTERIAGPHDVVGTDPLFVASDDYHLRASSPAVDVGDNANAPSHDFEGNARPYGPAVDLGAFEVQEPQAVNSLRVSEGVSNTNSVTVTLTWKAPGQTGQSKTIEQYELRYDDQVISEGGWDQATVADPSIPAGQPGEVELMTMNLAWDSTDRIYFALRAFDLDDRSSQVSNAAFWPFESFFLPLVSASTMAVKNIAASEPAQWLLWFQHRHRSPGR